jgi:hypothetical protein
MKTEFYQSQREITESPKTVVAKMTNWKHREISAEEQDASDVADANRRLADPSEKRIAWEDLKAELGI